MTIGPAADSATRTDGGAVERAGVATWRRRVRLERQLHDGASLRISALTLRLGLLRSYSAEQDFQQAVGELQDELHVVLDELRAVAGKIYPSLLHEAGLGPALRELADDAGLPVTVRTGDERFGTAAEGAAYFAVADCLETRRRSNGPVEVTVHGAGGQLLLSLTGVSTCHAERMADHARPLGGSVEVDSGARTGTGADTDGPGGGTITMRIPCE